MTDIMSVQYFLLIFFGILYLLAICCSSAKLALTSGPYKTSVVSVKDCSNPGRPYLKNPPMIFNISIQNIDGKNMLTRNYIVSRDTKDVTTKVKSFVWHKGKWQPAYAMNKLDCHGMLLRFTFSVYNIKYDIKNCMYLKGITSFKNVDLNQLEHIWIAIMPYARLMWRVETYSNTRMCIYCKEFDTVSEPA